MSNLSFLELNRCFWKKKVYLRLRTDFEPENVAFLASTGHFGLTFIYLWASLASEHPSAGKEKGLAKRQSTILLFSYLRVPRECAIILSHVDLFCLFVHFFVSRKAYCWSSFSNVQPTVHRALARLESKLLQLKSIVHESEKEDDRDIWKRPGTTCFPWKKKLKGVIWKKKHA